MIYRNNRLNVNIVRLRIIFRIRVNVAVMVQNIIEQESARYNTTYNFRPSNSINKLSNDKEYKYFVLL